MQVDPPPGPRRAPAEPQSSHWYLAILAVHPDVQGRGTGTTLLRSAHECLDLARAPAYLEASSLPARDLYQHHGYALCPGAPFHLPDGGPLMWPMWRQPRIQRHNCADRQDMAMRWDETTSVLREWQPHIVLCQEISATAPGALRVHLWTTANTLGMIPLLGPPAPGSATGNHPAVLVAASAGLVILDAGPAWQPAAGTLPAWCEALVQLPGWAHLLRAYSGYQSRAVGTGGMTRLQRSA